MASIDNDFINFIFINNIDDAMDKLVAFIDHIDDHEIPAITQEEIDDMYFKLED